MSNIFKSSKPTKSNKDNVNEEKEENRENFFMKKIEKKENFVFEEGNFPSLGVSKTKTEPVKSFSAALNHEQKTKKKEKDKWADWITIKKDGTVIQHEDSGRYQRVRQMLDELDEERRQNRYEKYIYEQEVIEEFEYYLNGPEYIQSWEVNNYLEKYEKEMKRNEEQINYSDNEDYSDYY